MPQREDEGVGDGVGQRLRPRGLEQVLGPLPPLGHLLDQLVGDRRRHRPAEGHLDQPGRQPGRQVHHRPGVDGGLVLLRLAARDELHGAPLTRRRRRPPSAPRW